MASSDLDDEQQAMLRSLPGTHVDRLPAQASPLPDDDDAALDAVFRLSELRLP